MDERARRMGENEVLYREVNERVRDLQTGFALDDRYVEFVCECARLECYERIRLTPEEYERLRENGRRFAIVHGHDEPEVERVVEENDRFAVVEKNAGEAAALAEAEDPRD
jgi:hypothetical protein